MEIDRRSPVGDLVQLKRMCGEYGLGEEAARTRIYMSREDCGDPESNVREATKCGLLNCSDCVACAACVTRCSQCILDTNCKVSDK